MRKVKAKEIRKMVVEDYIGMPQPWSTLTRSYKGEMKWRGFRRDYQDAKKILRGK